MNKKFSSLLMAAIMSTTAVTPAFASEVHVTEAGGTGNSKVTFEVVDTGSPEDPTIFSAYVPAVLPIKMDLDGNITVPTNAVIRNGVADKAIQVEAATVTTTGDWQHTDMSAAGSGSADSHLLGLELNGQDLKSATFPWKIEAASSLDLNMEAVIPQQTTVASESEIATIGFTLDWAKDKEELNATNEIDKAKMDAALKNLTGKLIFTTTAYEGEGGIDISKNGDGSVIAVVSGQDATVYSDGGVLGRDTQNVSSYDDGMFYAYNASSFNLHGLDTSKMINMSRMFFYCKNLTTLDLSRFNTSSVTNMAGMIYNCYNLQTVDLSSFDTSSVTDMAHMFRECNSLTTLDLSSFDTNMVMDTTSMFLGCNKLNAMYGRTQADCDKLNASSTDYTNVNFIVKSSTT